MSIHAHVINGDLKKLTDIEHEAIGLYLIECLDLKVEETYNVEN